MASTTMPRWSYSWRPSPRHAWLPFVFVHNRETLVDSLHEVCANTSDLLDKFQLAYDRTAGCFCLGVSHLDLYTTKVEC